MKLSSDLLAEITESVTIVGRDEPREADRRSPRVRLSSHLVGFNWADASKPFGIRVHNLSEGGVGILNNERIALDEKLVIRFPRAKNQHLLVLGTVVFWEPLAENLYAIGVQFDRVIEQAELESQSVPQSEQGNVFSRLTQVFARNRRVAS
jgi:hypothetical protein